MPPNDPDPMFAAFYERCEEPAAWHPDCSSFAGEPCIRREASRVYRWLIYVMLAGLLAFALCNKSCGGRAVQQVKGGSNG